MLDFCLVPRLFVFESEPAVFDLVFFVSEAVVLDERLTPGSVDFVLEATRTVLRFRAGFLLDDFFFADAFFFTTFFLLVDF
ncbi:MAG: hypothetical protein ACR2NZ_07795, partial [Rubripirellula sp.]